MEGEKKAQAVWDDDESYDSDEGEAGIGLDNKDAKAAVEKEINPPYNDYFDKENEKTQIEPKNQGGQGSQINQKAQRDSEDRKNEDRPAKHQNKKNYDKPFKKDFEKKTFDFNPDSNFRLYYLNDQEFYEVVISKEEPPFEFKIHLFLDNPNEDEPIGLQTLTDILTKKLNLFEAQNIRDKLDQRQSEKGGHDRIRYTFEITDRNQALKCYKFFSGYSQW